MPSYNIRIIFEIKNANKTQSRPFNVVKLIEADNEDMAIAMMFDHLLNVEQLNFFEGVNYWLITDIQVNP